MVIQIADVLHKNLIKTSHDENTNNNQYFIYFNFETLPV